MTTIIWHGSTRELIVDAMVSYRDFSAEAANKIVDLTPLKLTSRDNEKLLAIAFSGNAQGIKSLTNFLVEGLGDWEGAARYVQRVGAIFQPGHLDTSAILITSKYTYHIVMRRGIEINRFDLNDFVALGSGARAALTAHRVFGADAYECLLAAVATDVSTGFLALGTKVTPKGLKDQWGHYINDVTQEVAELRNQVPERDEINLKKKAVDLSHRFGQADELFPKHRLGIVRTREDQLRKPTPDSKKKPK